MGQQIFHRREEEAIVSGTGQHDLSAAEGFGDGIGHIGAGQVHLHYLCALCTQLFGHEVGCCTGVAVDVCENVVTIRSAANAAAEAQMDALAAEIVEK